MIEGYLDKVCVLCIPDCDDCVNFFDEFLFFIVIKVHVPFGKPRLPRPILDENKTDLKIAEQFIVLLKDLFKNNKFTIL